MESKEKCSVRLGFCTFTAAKYAVEHWHYSKVMPAGKLVKIGVWEDSIFKGVIIFGRGANNNLASAFNFEQTECVELCRVALTAHKTAVTRLVSIALRLLVKQSPNLKLVVSYADSKQGHLGKIYQAGNWIYTGESIAESAIDPETGEMKHTRSLHSKYGSIKGFTRVKDMPKFRYCFPLTSETRQKVLQLSKVYPSQLQSSAENRPPLGS